MSSAYGVMIKQKDKEGFVFVLALTNFHWPCQGQSHGLGLAWAMVLVLAKATERWPKAQDLRELLFIKSKNLKFSLVITKVMSK